MAIMKVDGATLGYDWQVDCKAARFWQMHGRQDRSGYGSCWGAISSMTLFSFASTT